MNESLQHSDKSQLIAFDVDPKVVEEIRI